MLKQPTPSRYLIHPKAWIALFVILFFTVLMARITLPYLSFKIDAGFLVTKQSIIHITPWRYAFYIHVCTSIFVLLTGVFQFIKPIVYAYKKLHRFLGTLYVSIIVLLSGPSGLIMGYYANGGTWAKCSFIILSVLWVGLTAYAYIQALRRNIPSHQNFMARSYALTLSAITLRTYAYFIPMFLHITGKEEYVLIAWLSWVPNLIIAEVLIRTNKATH